jgi:hypothetical protein
MTMVRFMLEISPELSAAVDAARADRYRNPAIEEWLWRERQIREAAKRIGVEKPFRRKRGRPPAEA